MVVKSEVFRRLCLARDLLADVDDAPRVREVARVVSISPFHFIRQFEAVFGVTPHQFRTGERLHRAKLLLARGQSVTDVCMELGFSSLGSFSTLFARRVGQSPAAFRKKMRTMVQVPGEIPRRLVPGCFDLMAHLPAWAFGERFAIVEKRSRER